MIKENILETLETFVNKRPGLEPANYAGRPDLYRQDYREGCLQPLQDFRKLVEAVRWRDSIWEDDLRRAFREAFSGRLSLHEPEGYAGEISYTPGQYGAVEYRNAACAVLARALWNYWGSDTPEGKTPREHVESTARNELGRGVARRWFN